MSRACHGLFSPASGGFLRRAGRGLFDQLSTLVLPDDCRVCGEALREFTRVPVCQSCLEDVQAFEAEFYCASCKTPFVNRAPLDEHGNCPLCRLGLKGFDGVYTFGSYEGTLRELIQLYKYSGMTPLAQTFGKLLARAVPREASFDLVVPMPLHWRKRWQRGFNQTELLAAEIARRWQVPVVRAARRKKYTQAQAGLTNAKRRTNVAGAFAVEERFRNRLDGQHVLLVDDVMTTGATASACARALKRAGAARVTLLTIARTDRRSSVDGKTLGAHA